MDWDSKQAKLAIAKQNSQEGQKAEKTSFWTSSVTGFGGLEPQGAGPGLERSQRVSERVYTGKRV